MTQKPTEVEFAEIGRTGLNRWGNNVYEEFMTNLRHPQAAKVYREMADNDPTIGAIMYMTTQLIRKASWSVKPASESEADVAAAEFLESCMDDMSVSWANTITDILSMLVYGYSFHEIVYKVRKGPTQKQSKFRSKYSDGRIGWAKIAGRSQQTLYGWDFADNGDIKAFLQTSPPKFDRTTIPLSKGLLFRTTTVSDNPEGRSLLRNAYRPWYFKKRIEEIEGIGIERDLAGLPVIIPPENSNIWDPQDIPATQMKARAEAMVRNVRRDRSEGIVLPYGWEFKLMSTGGSRQFDTNAIINRYDNRIAITMLADIVMMGGDKVGSFALGEVKQSLLAASLEAIIQGIADVFNTFAVPKLFEFNYFPNLTDLPQIKPGEVETPNIKDLAFLLRAGGLNAQRDLPLMNLLRSLVSLDNLTPEEFEEIYAKYAEGESGNGFPESGDNPVSGDSQNVDPVGHMMDDGNQNYEGR